MDRPLAYRGGLETIFRRGESAAFFGREIGLMYVHSHLRYAEAISASATARRCGTLSSSPIRSLSPSACAMPRAAAQRLFQQQRRGVPRSLSSQREWERRRRAKLPSTAAGASIPAARGFSRAGCAARARREAALWQAARKRSLPARRNACGSPASRPAADVSAMARTPLRHRADGRHVRERRFEARALRIQHELDDSREMPVPVRQRSDVDDADVRHVSLERRRHASRHFGIERGERSVEHDPTRFLQ